jgi:Xaa-Pro aminopeptidase
MIEALVNTARPKVRENEVWAEMARTMIVEGGEGYLFNQLASGSIDDKWWHLLHGKGLPLGPTTRPLGNHDVIVTEFHSNYAGYLVGAEFTALVGSNDKNVAHIHSVAVECLKKVVPKFRPGNTLQEVVETIRRPVIEAGLSYIELGFHGHGLSSPEFPTYVYSEDTPYEAGVGMEKVRLKEGMVFGLNIDLHDPRWRNDIGVMFGDTVVVSDSPRLLADVPLELPVCR